ncbi:MAG: hypothetical protein RXR82_07880 [Nitrososphaeria archaeon]
MSAVIHGHGPLSRRKAISEMLAVIILLSLTIVAGVLVYQIFTGKANVASGATAVSIQSVTISGENGVMTITVQNTGTTTIQSLNVTVYGSGGSTVSLSGSFTPSSIAPGQTASGTFTGSFSPGAQYTVVVTATAAGGSTTTATATVTAS